MEEIKGEFHRRQNAWADSCAVCGEGKALRKEARLMLRVGQEPDWIANN